MGNKKSPSGNGITGKILKNSFKIFPRYITEMFNGFLNRGFFPVMWKITKLLPITKLEKDKCEGVTKVSPIRFINTEGKVLEKLFMYRINHHVFSHKYMNKKQYGFTPKMHDRCGNDGEVLCNKRTDSSSHIRDCEP